jgi:acetylornithine deacetylase/succinyl-diaminopimelate desuccinylase-like protein
MRDMAMGATAGAGKRLEELINLPSLNVRGLSSARIGDDATNVVPSTATATIDLRLVKGIGRLQQAERVVAHIRKQGYFVTSAEPDEETRRAHPRVARVVVDESGYDAVRAPVGSEIAKRVIAAVTAARGTPLLQPSMGGSVPIAPVEAILGTPTILIPIANFDNSQHSSNENIRLGNLWNGIVTQAALMMMP